jgi:uncharacterized damage-inducible protein DinB
MVDILKEQYSLIKHTRENLFAFLEGIPLEKLYESVPNFGSGSIINTHIHVADCYRYWLGSFAMGQKRSEFAFATENDIERSNVKDVRDIFEQADEVVERFLDEFRDRWTESVANQVKWQKDPWSATPLWLLTHTETHEFHHKGQIVAMARHFGYQPPDTDLREPAE